MASHRRSASPQPPSLRSALRSLLKKIVLRTWWSECARYDRNFALCLKLGRDQHLRFGCTSILSPSLPDSFSLVILGDISPISTCGPLDRIESGKPQTQSSPTIPPAAPASARLHGSLDKSLVPNRATSGIALRRHRIIPTYTTPTLPGRTLPSF